jgi:hypothetical protein
MWQDVSPTFPPIFDGFGGNHGELNFWHEACIAF